MTINIHQSGSSLDFVPKFSPAMHVRALQSRRFRFASAAGGVIEIYEPMMHWWTGRPNAGLLPVIDRLAGQCGTTGRISRTPFAHLAEPMVVPQFSLASDPGLPVFTRSVERGLVRYGRSVDKSWLMAQLCLAYPACGIGVMVGSRAQVAGICERLKAFAVESNDCGPQSRVLVGVVGDFADSRCDYLHRSLLILPDPTCAATEFGATAHCNPDHRSRVLGFLERGRKLPRSIETYVRGLFGFAEFPIPEHGFTDSYIETWQARITSSLSLRTMSSGRITAPWLWRNRSRNLAVARIARQYRLDLVAAELPEIAPDIRERRVVVLVDAVEHAIALSGFLRRWPIVAADEFNHFGLSAMQAQSYARQASRSPDSMGFIATVDGFARLNPVSYQIVIWSGGRPVAPHLPDIHTTCPQAPLRHHRFVRLVDIIDRCSPLMRQWSRSRIAEYRGRGWYRCGESRLDGRVYDYIGRCEVNL